MSHCAEYIDWMEKNQGILINDRKNYDPDLKKYYKAERFVLFDCDGHKKGCRGCSELDSCDSCKISLCYYLAKCIDGEVLCPACWELLGCREDDRIKATIDGN